MSLTKIPTESSGTSGSEEKAWEGELWDFLLYWHDCREVGYSPPSIIVRLWSRVSFCTRHMSNDSQSQSTFAASQSKDMLKYDQPVKKPMM